MKQIVTAILLAAVSMTLVTADASASKNKKVKASRGQVERACANSGGIVYGTGGTGTHYGCLSDDAWIDCDKNGKCTGGTLKVTAHTSPRSAPRQTLNR